MRRVLVLSYFFPPTPSIGGVRASGLARYLPRFGWEAVVVTPRAPDRGATGFRVAETEDRPAGAWLKRRLGGGSDAALKDLLAVPSGSGSALRRAGARAIDLAKALGAFPDQHRGWMAPAVRAGRALIRDGGIEAVLSTSPPVAAHVVARRLAAESGLPWIADFRDLWADNHNSTAPGWRRGIDRRIERRTLTPARSLVTVSAPLADQLRARYPGADVHAILNGFDPAEQGPTDRLTPEFTLTHTGTFYQGRRDPGPLLAAIAGLLGEGRMARARVRVRFYSRHEDWLADVVRRHGLEDVVEIRPWAPRVEALAAQRESQVLVLLHWGADAERGVYTGKIFEYLAARRPILVVGGGAGVLADLVRDTGAGVHARDAAEIRAALAAWWHEYALTGAVPFHGIEQRIEHYSQVRMAAEFAAVLDAAAGTR